MCIFNLKEITNKNWHTNRNIQELNNEAANDFGFYNVYGEILMA